MAQQEDAEAAARSRVALAAAGLLPAAWLPRPLPHKQAPQRVVLPKMQSDWQLQAQPAKYIGELELT